MEREAGIETATASLGSCYSGVIFVQQARRLALLASYERRSTVQTFQFNGENFMEKKIEELRESEFHQELGQKFCAAFIAQQQGIALNTALKKIARPVGDLWLLLAEFARRGFVANADVEVCSKLTAESSKFGV